jgi:hypothetical protein
LRESGIIQKLAQILTFGTISIVTDLKFKLN